MYLHGSLSGSRSISRTNLYAKSHQHILVHEKPSASVRFRRFGVGTAGPQSECFLQMEEWRERGGLGSAAAFRTENSILSRFPGAHSSHSDEFCRANPRTTKCRGFWPRHHIRQIAYDFERVAVQSRSPCPICTVPFIESPAKIGRA